MEPFDELLTMAETAHGHLCAGQILGVRMALLGCQRLACQRLRDHRVDLGGVKGALRMIDLPE